MTFFWQNPLLHGLPMPGWNAEIHTVGEDRGTYYLISSGTRWNEPEVYYSWYPIFSTTCHPSMFVGERLDVGPQIGRTFEYIHPEQRNCRVVIRGDVVPVKVEHVDAPKPKVRRGIEIRWREGHWQKKLKRGWVPA